MKAKWKDYKHGAWLVLLFGKVDANIIDLDGSDALNKSTMWGIITHPAGKAEFFGTRDEAKRTAELMLKDVLTIALARL